MHCTNEHLLPQFWIYSWSHLLFHGNLIRIPILKKRAMLLFKFSCRKSCRRIRPAGIYILKKIRNYTKTKVQNGETLPKLNIGIYSKFDQYYRYDITMYDFIHIIQFLFPIWSWISKMMQEMQLFSLFFWNVARAALLFKSPVVVLPISTCFSNKT